MVIATATAAKEQVPLKGWGRKAVDWFDRYTSPRPETAGNLEKPSFFQAIFNGGADG
ncbi:MAG: hypothetical protein HY319_07490 [Armatimonadetes bacterium]|nr:hypothetical protein [Armatimonadota bacterium]